MNNCECYSNSLGLYFWYYPNLVEKIIVKNLHWNYFSNLVNLPIWDSNAALTQFSIEFENRVPQQCPLTSILENLATLTIYFLLFSDTFPFKENSFKFQELLWLLQGLQYLDLPH